MKPLVIITTTTIPIRLVDHNGNSATRLALETLLNQTYDNYELHLNIPFSYNNTAIEIPHWLQQMQEKYSYLKIYRCDDSGPITKILPTLERIVDNDAIIITADDDLYYMPGMIEAHLIGRAKYPDAALGFAGMASIDGSCHFCTTLPKDTRVKVLEGYKTVSYKRSFFGDLNDFKNMFVGRSWRDDETLSAFMGYRNVPKIVLTYEHDTDFTPRVESFPVIGHVPTESSGCVIFRNSEESQKKSELAINEWFKLGYLER